MLRIVILTVLLVGIVHAQDPSCSWCGLDGVCKLTVPGQKCERILGRGILPADQNVIVNTHNELRNRVALGQETRGDVYEQPNAGNMKKMSWDPELAISAQRWADQCDYGHNICRQDSLNRFDVGVGENIHLSFGGCDSWSPNINFSAPIHSWYNEVDKFNPDNLSPFTLDMNTGHYTQLVWGDTYKVGCGATTFEYQGQCQSFVVCDYGPSGNIDTGTVYTEDTARSACPDSPEDSNYPGLCG